MICMSYAKFISKRRDSSALLLDGRIKIRDSRKANEETNTSRRKNNISIILCCGSI